MESSRAYLTDLCTSTQFDLVCFFILFLPFQRVHLDIQVGEHAIDYANVAQKEKLSELQLRVRQLLDQVEQITKEQNYQRVSNMYNIVLQQLNLGCNECQRDLCCC